MKVLAALVLVSLFAFSPALAGDREGSGRGERGRGDAHDKARAHVRDHGSERREHRRKLRREHRREHRRHHRDGDSK